MCIHHLLNKYKINLPLSSLFQIFESQRAKWCEQQEPSHVESEPTELYFVLEACAVPQLLFAVVPSDAPVPLLPLAAAFPLLSCKTYKCKFHSNVFDYCSFSLLALHNSISTHLSLSSSFFCSSSINFFLFSSSFFNFSSCFLSSSRFLLSSSCFLFKFSSSCFLFSSRLFSSSLRFFSSLFFCSSSCLRFSSSFRFFSSSFFFLSSSFRFASSTCLACSSSFCFLFSSSA